jgi:phytoene/squalene synthetase
MSNLKDAMRLGSAFQKVNFLGFKDDNLVLNRNYFPGVDLNSFDENVKLQSSMKMKKISESLTKAL